MHSCLRPKYKFPLRMAAGKEKEGEGWRGLAGERSARTHPTATISQCLNLTQSVSAGLLCVGIFCIDSNIQYAAYPNVNNACARGEQFAVQVRTLAIFLWMETFIMQHTSHEGCSLLSSRYVKDGCDCCKQSCAVRSPTRAGCDLCVCVHVRTCVRVSKTECVLHSPAQLNSYV